MEAASIPRDRLDELTDLILGDLKTPKEQVDRGKVPKPPPVVVENPIGDNIQNYDRAEVLRNLSLLKDAHSVCQMFINIMLLQTKPDGYDVTKQAAEAFNVQAKLAYKAMFGPMGSFYNFSEPANTKHEFDIPKSQVHEKLLDTMFDGMRLDPDHKKTIDIQITDFAKALTNITMDGKDITHNFALRFGLTPAINLTGDTTDPIWVFEPTTYFIYLVIDANAFKKAVSKNNSEERIKFKYEQTVTKCHLNANNFLRQRPNCDAMFEKVAGMSLKQYGEALNISVKKSG